MNKVVPDGTCVEEAKAWGREIAVLSPTAIEFLKYSFNIDTEMQARLRDNPADGFPDQGHFVNLQRNGGLAAPAEAAARVLAYLDRTDFGSQPVADVRDA